MTVHLAVSQLRRDQMIRRFKECGIPIDVVGIEDISKVAGSVTQSVRKSIFKTADGIRWGRQVGCLYTRERRIALKSKSGVTTTAVSLKDYRIHDKFPSANVWMRRGCVSQGVSKPHNQIRCQPTGTHWNRPTQYFHWSHQCDSRVDHVYT
jgi:hypothetical protein